MTARRLPDNERILDLLAQEATVGLAEPDRESLDAWYSENADHDRDGLCFAAAALDLAALPKIDTAPDALIARVHAQAEKHFERLAASDPRTYPLRDSQLASAHPSSGWRRLAVAALIVIAVSGWSLALIARSSPNAVPVSRRLARLEADADDVIHIDWTSDVPGYESVRGQVIWSDAKQQGFMRLKGLPVNDPAANQYQLWIVDPKRGEQPVDGGVFDMPDSDEALVPIDAKLDVSAPSVFAITLEQPGGVVVSKGPLLVVAAVQ